MTIKKQFSLGILSWMLASLLLSCTAPPAIKANEDIEKSICGIKEPFIFWFWSSAAGKPNPAHLKNFNNVEDISIPAKDGKTLMGYKLKAASGKIVNKVPRGYLLVVQGNAMLADQIAAEFIDFSNAGYDVYIFDYRGYGRSEGKRRLKAILSDYSEIIDHLDSSKYSDRLFYGMSFGGIILLEALKNKPDDKLVVIDSTPSRLSDYGCPEEHDPVNNLPEDSKNYMIILGQRDQVVKPESSKELFNLAKERGAFVLDAPDFGHPFMDKDKALQERRMEAIKSFLMRDP